MNLLGAALYDPAAAVSKATSSLLAMTAVDTTNLRITATVPAHGMIRVKLQCAVTGATTTPSILLGVMVGAAVKGRVAPLIQQLTNNVATTDVTAVAEFTITGLAPGSTVFDAAYAVQVVVASTNIKYGGPNDTTGNDAWGAFVFEIWDPQPLPTALAGAAGGLQIAGSNAATTYASLTVTNAMTISDGLVINRSTANSVALAITGNGTGAGATITGGAGATTTAGGAGLTITGGAGGTTGASGAGLSILGGAAGSTSGNASPAITATGGAAAGGTGTGAEGFKATGGAASSTAAGGNGATITGGASSGANDAGSALSLVGPAGGTTGKAGHGLLSVGGQAGSTNGAGGIAIKATGGAAGAGTGAGGSAISAFGGAASTTAGAGVGVVMTGGIAAANVAGPAAVGCSITGGAGAASGSGAAGGATISAGGTNTVASAAHGLSVSGTSTGSGLNAQSGAGATGDGITVQANSTAGYGLFLTGSGANEGFRSVGGATGAGAVFQSGGTSGDGMKIQSVTSGNGLVVTAQGTTKHGIKATGGATSSDGINATGGGTGHGINATGGSTGNGGLFSSGAGATGDGIKAVATSTNGNGLTVTGTGTGVGLNAGGGAATSTTLITSGGSGPTAAQVATAVWQDTTAGDFTVAASIGKSVMNGVALGTGLTINGYTGDTPQTGDAFARLGAPAGASVSADIAAIKSDSGAIKTKTDSLTFTIAGMVDSNVIDWKSATAPAMTGDAFARLGAPAGASISADIAAVKAAQLTGAAMATAIWTDTTAGDFTTALSIGKSVMNGVALGTGLKINSYNGDTPQTGDCFARLGAPAGASVSADIAAINAKTTNLPAAPADETLVIAATNAIMTRIGAPVGATISADIAGVKSDTGSIKTKTDSLTFTVAGQVDSNVQYVNDTQVTGNGHSGTEWGPV